MLNFLRKRTPIAKTQTLAVMAPLVFTGSVLTASAANAIADMLVHGTNVLVVRSAPDYSDTGAPLCFGRGAFLTYDSATGLVDGSYVDHFDRESAWKRALETTVFKISDREALDAFIRGTHSAG